MELAESSAEPQMRRHSVRGWRLVLVACALALCIMLGIRTFIADVYYIPSDSMEPTYMPGDRVLVSKLSDSSHIHRGDIVVFDGAGSLSPYKLGDGFWNDPVKHTGQWLGLAPTETVYIKRVIALEGDTVSCCTDQGKITLNGEPLDEPYIYPQDSPSTTKFNVVVPRGRMWVMGDHRSVSVDSRSLLGAPGGGLIRTDKIIGTVDFRLHF